MWQAVRYGIRGLRKNPGFTLVAMLTLALGIGANTAIFSVVDALLLRPLPLKDPERLVFLSGSDPQRGLATVPFSLPSYEMVRDQNRAFEGVAAFCSEGITLTGSGDPVQLSVARVAPDFFDVLGTRPLLGRGFRAAEGEPGAIPVALISRRLWETRFASDPAILGKPITLGEMVYEVIGVVPPDFRFPDPDVDIWITRLIYFAGLHPDQIRNGGGYLLAIARLRRGVTPDQADADLAVIYRQYRREHPRNPDADPRGRFDVVPLQENLVSGIRPTLWLLTGAVAFVLLIASANVASVAMVRAAGRGREIALRAALGAGPGAVIRQLLVESLLLATGGAALGILLSEWAVPLLLKLPGVNLPGFRPVRVDVRVLVVTLAASVITGLLFGILPALQVSRPRLNEILRDGGRGSTGGAARHRVRGLLVSGQIALSLVLLIGAGLLLESFRQLQAVNPGFDPHHAIAMRIALPPARYPDDAHRARFMRELIGRLEVLPGVRSASASLGLPLAITLVAPVLAEGQPAVPPAQRPLGVWNAITPDYFKTLGIPLVRGRAFSWSDDETAPRTLIISESMARRFWPSEDPIGKRILYARREVDAEVVGVAADVKTRGLDADAGMVFYTPYPQFTWPNVRVTIRSEGDPRTLLKCSQSAGSGGRPRPAGHPSANSRRLSRRRARAAAPDDVPGRGLRRRRPDTCAGGTLRRDGVRGGAAYYRDRHPAGDRGPTDRYFPDGVGPGVASEYRRHRSGCDCRRRPDTADRAHAVPRQRHRPADVRGHFLAVPDRGACGELRSGVARYACGSSGGAAASVMGAAVRTVRRISGWRFIQRRASEAAAAGSQ